VKPVQPLRLGLIGDPVDHSRSPELYRAFLAEAGLAGTYATVRVPTGEGAVAIARLRNDGFTGLNVTTPLKEEAFAACAEHDAVASVARSVNTIQFGPTATRGCNTDGAGAVGAVEAALGSCVDRAVLILGAGPTARAAVYALLAAGARVSVWNRTPSRLAPLVALGATVWRGRDGIDAALSALAPMSSLDNAELRNALTGAPAVIDANYGPRATLDALLGRPVIDGLDMLRASARASFDLFAAHARLQGDRSV
jgi:shikimate 5-dehydrogenase